MPRAGRLGRKPGEMNKPCFVISKNDDQTPLRTHSVGEKVYDAEYFTRHAGGADWYEQFVSGGGESIYPIYREVIETLKPKPNERVLDIGCGRGEITGILAMNGVKAFGLDFSSAALTFASTVRDEFARDHGISFHLRVNSYLRLMLPMSSNTW